MEVLCFSVSRSEGWMGGLSGPRHRGSRPFLRGLSVPEKSNCGQKPAMLNLFFLIILRPVSLGVRVWD